LNDVTLVTDDLTPQEFPANKAVLSANSDVLKQVLTNSSDPHPRIFMQGVQKQDLTLILDFMYSGVVNVEQKAMDRFLDLGKHLQFKEISAKSLNITPVEKVDKMLKAKEEKKRKLRFILPKESKNSRAKAMKKEKTVPPEKDENIPMTSPSETPEKKGDVKKKSVIVSNPSSLEENVEKMMSESEDVDDTLNLEKDQLIDETDLLEMQVRNSANVDKDQIKEEVVSTEESIKDLYDDFTAKNTDEEELAEKEVDIANYENVLVTTDNEVFDAFPVNSTLDDDTLKKSKDLTTSKDSETYKKFVMKHVLEKNGNSVTLRKCKEKEKSKRSLKPKISKLPEKAYFEVDVGGNSAVKSNIKTTDKAVLKLEENNVSSKSAPHEAKQSITAEESSSNKEEKIEKPKPKPKVIEVGPNGIKYQNLDPSIFGSHTKVPKVSEQERPKNEIKQPSIKQNESVKCPECGFQVGHKILLKNHIESRHYKLFRDIFIFKTVSL